MKLNHFQFDWLICRFMLFRPCSIETRWINGFFHGERGVMHGAKPSWLPGWSSKPIIWLHLAVLREPWNISGQTTVILQRVNLPCSFLRRRFTFEWVGDGSLTARLMITWPPYYHFLRDVVIVKMLELQQQKPPITILSINLHFSLK